MRWKNPGFVPADGMAGYAYNPSGSLPYPQAQNMPVGCWDGGAVKLQLRAATGAETFYRRGEWASPIFDLRPDLRGVSKSTGQSVTAGGVRQSFDLEGTPIWNGQSAGLWIQVNGLDGNNSWLNQLTVESEELASPNDVGLLQRFTDKVDISSEFVSRDQKPTTLLQFIPVGQGYSCRYWQIKLTFTWQDTLAVEPIFGIRSAMY